MTATPCDVIERARNYVGVPYRHQGRSRLGVDCIGLAWLVCRDIGVSIDDVTGYGPEPSNGTLLREVSKRGLLASGPHAGTLVLMRWFDEPQHCAVVTDIGTVIHAHSKVRKVVEHRLDDKWSKRIVTYFGFPGVTYEAGVLLPQSKSDVSTVAVSPVAGQLKITSEQPCLPCRKKKGAKS